MEVKTKVLQLKCKELRETRNRWRNFGNTAEQVSMVWACAVKRRQ